MLNSIRGMATSTGAMSAAVGLISFLLCVFGALGRVHLDRFEITDGELEYQRRVQGACVLTSIISALVLILCLMAVLISTLLLAA
jgi:hypothetical protein